MTLVEHLGELRRRLVVCVCAFAAGAVVTYVVYARLLVFLEGPLRKADPQKGSQLFVTGPLDAFGVRLDVSAFGGVVLALPVILFQLWRFVTPGLKANEKRYAFPFVISMILLFCGGATVAWITFPHALGFLHAAGGPGIADIFTPQKYFNLIEALILIFGLTFEFPVVLVAVELAGVVTPAQLSHWRRVAIVILVITAAVITPSSDPFSMLALAVPLLVFYEVAILLGRILKR